jgi:hypothetical protein
MEKLKTVIIVVGLLLVLVFGYFAIEDTFHIKILSHESGSQTVGTQTQLYDQVPTLANTNGMQIVLPTDTPAVTPTFFIPQRSDQKPTSTPAQNFKAIKENNNLYNVKE